MGASGGMEAMTLFHQLVYRLWSKGVLIVPLVRVKVDERNCFGSLEWSAVRNAMRDTLPHMQSAVCLKHRYPSHVEIGAVTSAFQYVGVAARVVPVVVDSGVSLQSRVSAPSILCRAQVIIVRSVTVQ